MKLAVILWLLIAVAEQTNAQPPQPAKPIEPAQENPAQPNMPQDSIPNFNLGDWKTGMNPTAPTGGVTLYFDYTKFFEWLLPKQHPKIPPECDPKFFLDSIPPAPIFKQDSIPASKPPV